MRQWAHLTARQNIRLHLISTFTLTAGLLTARYLYRCHASYSQRSRAPSPLRGATRLARRAHRRPGALALPELGAGPRRLGGREGGRGGGARRTRALDGDAGGR